MVTELWNALGEELKEFEKAYNDRFGRQGIYVEIWPDTINARAGTEVLTIKLNRQTGNVSGWLGGALDLHMHVAAGELKMVWLFEGVDPSEPADIALALGERLTALSAGLSDEPDVS